MANLLNTTARPLSVSVPYRDNNGVGRSRRVRCVPGQTADLSAGDLKALRTNPGFNKFVKDNWLVVTNESETAADVAVDAVTISDAAQELADREGLDLNTVEPNNAGKITLSVVQKAVKAQNEL
jgi:hypothetical protein